MYVLLVGLNHRTAPVEVREKFAICGVDLNNAYDYFKNSGAIEGAVILTTCNRTEIYATAKKVEKGMNVLQEFMVNYSGVEYDVLKDYLYKPTCYDAILHLFRVASGLDSMILGESQIISQVKEAYQKAVDVRASDGVLNTLFQKAIYVGKKVRTDTDIDRHSLSISHAAVELARKLLGSLEKKTVVVVGAGEMSELTTRYLMQNGVQSVIVSNRSYEKALSMAQNFNGRAVRFENLADELKHAHIVISCTAASHYVIRQDNCKEILESRKGQKIIMIDIAVPRDIDPALQSIDGVFIYDIDKLQDVVDANYLERKREAQKAEKILVEELAEFNKWLATLYVVPVITALKSQGEAIKNEELQKAFNRLGKISEREQKIVSTLANSIVNRILHSPIVNLKEMAVSNEGHLYAEIVKKLFALSVDERGLEEYEQAEVGNKR